MVTYFVRTRSSGASMRPVSTAAETAKLKDAHGELESSKSADGPKAVVTPGSGIFSIAASSPFE